MDTSYSFLRDVPYANKYTNFSNSSSNDMATLYFNGVANGEQFEMTGRDSHPITREVPQFNEAAFVEKIEMTERDRMPTFNRDVPIAQEDKKFNKNSCRKVCYLVSIIAMISAVIAFVFLGINFLPEPTNPPPPGSEPLPFCSGTIAPTASASAQSNCSRIPASVAFDIAKVRVFFPGNKTIVNENLTNSITVAELWTIHWSKDTQNLTVSPILGTLTCNMQGMYLFEYLDSSNTLVYYQNILLTYLGNLEDVHISAQPYVKENGVDKSIHLSCSMKTGCHHGIIIPKLKRGEETVLLHDTSCSYSFNISEGGQIICTTDIDEAVWISQDKVICSLRPDNGVHQLVNAGQMDIKKEDLKNFCSLVSFTIGEPGYINCKRRITGDVDIVLERKGHFFGDWTILLTISGEGSGKALDDRLSLKAKKIADIMEINITISEVHCGDKGYLALNYSDGTRTSIEIEVTSVVQPSCPESLTRSLHATNNFKLTCSWCPGHDVTEVLVDQTKTVNNSDMTSLLPFPISFSVDEKTEHQEQNLIIKFSHAYGVMTVDVTRFTGVGCRDGDDYTVTLRSPSGSSTKQIHISITVPESLYTYTLTNTTMIAGRNLDIEFKGFIGCAVNNLTATKDGVPLFAKDINVPYDGIRNARGFKIFWSYTPVTSDLNNKIINANVSFVPMGETVLRSHNISERFIVLEDSLCTNKPSCNIAHPSTLGLYIACSSTGRIEEVNRCPAGLSLITDTENCHGQCG